MEIPKKGILMAYVSDHRKWFGMGFPKKEIFDGLYKHFGGAFSEKLPKKGKLMDYISRSCDLQKSEKWGLFI